MIDSNEMLETCERLKAYPNLVEKVKGMLDLMEKKEVKSVDDFEEALIPEVRKLGKDITQTWAVMKEQQIRENLEERGKPHHSKKKSIGIQPLER